MQRRHQASEAVVTDSSTRSIDAFARVRGWTALLRRVDRSVWSILLLVLISAFVWRQRHELNTTLVQLRTTDFRWTLGLLATALAMHTMFTVTLSAIFARLGRVIPLRPALQTYAERQTVATIVPFGALPSVVTLARRYEAFGATRNDAVFAVLLYSLIGHASFLAFMLPTLVYLVAQGAMTGIMTIGATVFVLILAAIATLAVRLSQGKKLPDWLESRLPPAAHDFLGTAAGYHITPSRLAIPFGLSLVGDTLGAVGVYAALQAVGQNVSIGVAAAGYVVGTLFLLVAPMFQGLGLVEVSMTLALQQFGVPVGQALGATLLFRLGEVWLPVVFGIALQARRQPRLAGLPARLPAIWTGLNGLFVIGSVLPHEVHRALRHHLPHQDQGLLEFHNVSRTATLVIGFVFVASSMGLWRRQHAVWVVTVGGTAILTAVQMTHDIDRLGAILTAANLGLLLLYRDRFRVRSDAPTMQRGVGVAAATCALALAWGTASLWLVDRRQFGDEFSIRTAFTQAIDAYLSTGHAGLEPHTVYARWLIGSFHVIGVVSIVIAALAILRPVVWRHRTLPAERERARAFISAHGNSFQDEFRSWPDKLQFFSSTGDGVISYGLARGVALCLCDPVATDQAAARRVLSEFLELCDINAWETAFHQADGAFLPLYRAEGLVALKIGAEAVVDLETFSIEGRKGKKLRTVRNKFEREGYRVIAHDPPIGDDLVRQLRQVSDAWLTLDGRRERGFTLGQFTDDYVRRSVILALHNQEGTIDAFINLIPVGVPGDITFDMMRHRPNAPNGTMDSLMMEFFAYGKERGYTRGSLGMVPFVDVGTGPDADRREQALALLAKPLGRFFDSSSLHHFKNKFEPEWEPRYLVYRRDSRLPVIGLAIVQLTEGTAAAEAQPAPTHDLIATEELTA